MAAQETMKIGVQTTMAYMHLLNKEGKSVRSLADVLVQI
jgi:hypothetical protein